MQQHLTKILLLTLLLLSSCDYRTPSDSRMKKHTGVELPDNVIVLKDEYIEAGKDYSLQYNVQLDDNAMTGISKEIRTSKTFSNTVVEQNDTWMPSEKGYYYYLAEEGISYEVIVDTSANIIYYNEAG